MKNGLTITVTLRKRDTGYKVWAFCTDDMNGARTAAQILVDSPTFRHCFAVATDWQGDMMFECRPSGTSAPQVVQVPQYPQAALPTHGYGPAPQLPRTGSYGTQSGYGAAPSRSGYGAPPVPTGRSYGPAPVPHQQQVRVTVQPVQQPHPSLGARDAYGPPPVPHGPPKLLGSGK